jgi:hypothetical protein
VWYKLLTYPACRSSADAEARQKNLFVCPGLYDGGDGWRWKKCCLIATLHSQGRSSCTPKHDRGSCQWNVYSFHFQSILLLLPPERGVTEKIAAVIRTLFVVLDSRRHRRRFAWCTSPFFEQRIHFCLLRFFESTSERLGSLWGRPFSALFHEDQQKSFGVAPPRGGGNWT